MTGARRARLEEPNVRNSHTRITSTDVADEEGDVLQNVPAARLNVFRAAAWKYYKENGRHDLPWRKTTDPYKILVSEVMLQQTQVPRVIEKYKAFLIRFPNVRRLAGAPLSDVLKLWSGMGYNRRAKFLREAAQTIMRGYGGRVPKAAVVLRTLPGVGPYTAGAVRVFAFNEPDTLIETNIRAAYIHFFYASVLQKTSISDSELLPLIQKAAKGEDPREWHWALMDYGAHIKKLHKNPARRSAHYTRQSKFEGSLRQVRGAILRALADGPQAERSFDIYLSRRRLDKLKLGEALGGLARDGLIENKKGIWRIA